ncbi:hypothetical protein CUR178_00382 [Leishmania enriettii]|uniref:Uncharacterized protein n=1 Tax=Leishmania enriettii TaxID=5663 RepID=A0A836GV79_LEIEN|nr:hypothetical protein CUR178_00382 [Leishmania enriettii]
MDSAFSCSSHDLLALQRQARRNCTSLFPRQGDTCGDEIRGACAAVMRQSSAPRKAVQTLSFDEPLAYHRSSRGTTTSGAPGTSLKSSRVVRTARECGGRLCTTYHSGPHCFPTRRYRAALSRQRHGVGVRGGGFRCGCGETFCSVSATSGVLSSTAPVTRPEIDLWLLWSAVPPHLLMELIHTPEDAEVLLARLKEEQHLLRSSDSSGAPPNKMRRQ